MMVILRVTECRSAVAHSMLINGVRCWRMATNVWYRREGQTDTVRILDPYGKELEALEAAFQAWKRWPGPSPMMKPFRKRPVVVQAIQIEEGWFDGAPPDLLALPGVELNMKLRIVSISTLEGKMVGNIGDWIIRGVVGELYPCKPDIFDATYEPVGD